MKCQTVTKLLVALMLLAPFSATLAEISRTQVGNYNLSSDTYVIYNMNLTPNGGSVTLTRPENSSTQLSVFITSCKVGGKMVIKMREGKYAATDRELARLINYASNNNLRVSMKSLSAASQILLFEDSYTLMVVDKHFPQNNTEKCLQD